MTQKERNRVKVIYHWPGTGIVGSLAAAVHLGLISKKTDFTSIRRINLPFGGGFTGQNQGSLLFLGRAKGGEAVYLLPRGKKKELVLTAIRETALLLGDEPEYYYFVDCDQCHKKKTAEIFKEISHTVTRVEEELGK